MRLSERGHSIEFLLQLDIISFYLLADSSDRTAALTKYETAWTMMAAAQGNVDGMKKLTEPWRRASEVTPRNDAQRLLQDHG